MTSLIVVAVGADFGAAIYAEYRWARTVRAANGPGFRPLGGHPRVPVRHAGHAATTTGRWRSAPAASTTPSSGKASLEATLHSVDLTDTSWLIGPDAKLPVGKLESRIIVDSTHLGRFMGIKDLLVEAPPRRRPTTPPAAPPSRASPSNKGLVFTGTPTAAGFDEKVSVSVDLSVAGHDETTLVFTATGVLDRCGDGRSGGARRRAGGGAEGVQRPACRE